MRYAIQNTSILILEIGCSERNRFAVVCDELQNISNRKLISLREDPSPLSGTNHNCADLCAGIDNVWPANYNAPEQTVISGTASGVAAGSPSAAGVSLASGVAVGSGVATGSSTCTRSPNASPSYIRLPS